jgi:hypothetical protein
MQIELRESVQKDVYKRFAHAAGYRSVSLFFTSVVVSQVVKTASDFYLAAWTSSSSSSSLSFIKVYSSLAFMNAVTLLLRGFAAASVLINASRVLHSRLADGVFYSPLNTIIRTSMGVLLNRFSQDFEALDGRGVIQIVFYYSTTVNIAVALLATLVVQPLLLLPLALGVFAFSRVHAFFGAAAREIRRTESACKAPMLAAASFMFNSQPLLRAMAAQAQATASLSHAVDAWASMYILDQSSKRWLALYLDSIAAAIVSCLTLCIVLAPVFPSAFPGASIGVAAASLTSTMQLTLLLNWFVRTSAEMNNMAAAGELQAVTTRSQSLMYLLQCSGS